MMTDENPLLNLIRRDLSLTDPSPSVKQISKEKNKKPHHRVHFNLDIPQTAQSCSSLPTKTYSLHQRAQSEDSVVHHNINAEDKGQVSTLHLVDPQFWRCTEVCQWLDRIELSEYQSVFREHDISGEDLMDLSDEDLQGMGITKLGHRKKILRHCRDLFNREDKLLSPRGSPHSLSSNGEDNPDDEQSIMVECVYLGATRRIQIPFRGSADSSSSIHRLKKKIREEFDIPQRFKVIIKIKEEEIKMEGKKKGGSRQRREKILKEVKRGNFFNYLVAKGKDERPRTFYIFAKPSG